jgi:lysyl-tRNA synthetase class 1
VAAHDTQADQRNRPAAGRSTEPDWVSRFADEVIAAADTRDKPGAIVCASGISPSGPVHLGNFRELMTPHLVADEIRRRGRACVHILSWDDYDRFRRVPAGVDPSWKQHIGKPLTAVPAPPGSSHPSWAEHFKQPLSRALAQLGIDVRPISQTRMYTSGAYTEQILLAMARRTEIDAVLGSYRTRPVGTGNGGRLSEEEAAAAAIAAEGSGAAADEDGSGSGEYFPYKPYCTVCGTDFTTVTHYDDTSTALTYSCRCGQSETVLLKDFRGGKLVWKVDWPMRWAYEGVDFEPSGADHTSPGSSFTVGGRLVGAIFGGTQPIGPMYAFVGITGMAKMSSSRGDVPTPADALRIMEAPLLRWMYARRRPNQSFSIAFDAEIFRVHDEWDALVRKVSTGAAGPAEVAAHSRAAGTAAGPLPTTPRPLPYRTLASVLDITASDPDQTLRILSELDPADPITDLDVTRPRLDRAATWVAERMPADSRTHVRTEPDAELLGSLTAHQQESLRLLVDSLAEHWSLAELTTLLYGVPKKLLGLPAVVAPTAELKAAQREYFVLLYRLLMAKKTGPRLPTLLLAVGQDRVRSLLGR